MDLNDLFQSKITNIDKQLRWSNIRFITTENLAEHSCIVAMLAIQLGFHFNEINKKDFVNIEKLSYLCIIHDIGEVYTCDITNDVKYGDPEIKKLVDKLENKLLEKNIHNKKLVDDISNCKSYGVEGILVELCDKLQAFYKFTRELQIQRTEAIYIEAQNVFQVCKNTIMKTIDQLSKFEEVKQPVIDYMNAMLIDFNNTELTINKYYQYLNYGHSHGDY